MVKYLNEEPSENALRSAAPEVSVETEKNETLTDGKLLLVSITTII